MRAGKLKRKWRQAFGRVPDCHYFDGDMTSIRAYFDFRRDNGPDTFFIDEITWRDLDMDLVYQRINPKRCTSGEQILYYMLRCPALDAEVFCKRKKLIDYAQNDPERRLRVETVLARLGCSRRADLCRAFYPDEHGNGRLVFYLLFLLLLVVSVLCAIAHIGLGVRGVAAALLLNSYIHEIGRRRSQRDYDTVNYVVNMIFAVRRLQKLRDGALDELIAPAYESMDRLQAVLRTGGISTGMDSGGFEDAVLTVTLLDLITYEFLKSKLGRCRGDVLTIHEYLGQLDAAISIASSRASLGSWAEPVLHFDGGHTSHIRAAGLTHPLLSDPVPNDCMTERPILITGSNASGKTTYLKTVALAVILAQSICTVTADSYESSAFRVYSSIAMRDDLLAGESCYLAETRSLKRILDASKGHANVFCVLDEVLRGTNTVERIAASSEILRAMADEGVLCLAATHDTELCDLLRNSYSLCHFEEQLGESGMRFDYVLRQGKASSQNAIRILRLLGFDPGIAERAGEKAHRYMQTGIWR